MTCPPLLERVHHRLDLHVVGPGPRQENYSHGPGLTVPRCSAGQDPPTVEYATRVAVDIGGREGTVISEHHHDVGSGDLLGRGVDAATAGSMTAVSVTSGSAARTGAPMPSSSATWRTRSGRGGPWRAGWAGRVR